MSALGRILVYATNIYLLLLFVRVVVELIMGFNRSFRASGIGAALLEVVYTLTDPPLRVLRRVIPPLRVGRVAFDLGFLVLVIALIVVRNTFFARL